MKNKKVFKQRLQSAQAQFDEANKGFTMTTRLGIKVSIILLCLSSGVANGKTMECALPASANEAITIDQLEFISHPVFDENKADSLYLHGLANWLHINTQQHVIQDLLPFTQTDSISKVQITEYERILNQHSFLRKSQISLVENCHSPVKNTLKVETWDTWSLVPSISFGRRAGNNKYAFGFKEDNFLGLGIHAGVQYKHDHLRSGYKLAFSMPLSFPKQSSLEFEFSDNDDGQKTYLSYSKPFYLQSSKQQYFASTLKETRRDSIYQNGDLAWQFSHVIEQTELAYAQLITLDEQNATRVHIGINKEQHSFTDLNSEVLLSLPRNRGFTSAWIGLEYSQANYHTFSNIRFIDHREDINLGWQFMTKIGLDIDSFADEESGGVHFENSLSKGIQLQNTLLLFSANHKVHWQKQQPDHHQLSAEFELYQYFTPRWAGYVQSQWFSEKNQYTDSPLALGGDSGVRGYSNQYQHGQHLWSASAELRFNPHWELYQLVNVAWAAFVDSGKAWGETQTTNSTDSTLSSIG
ncbi:MAG: BamA/TamA family outer membrane protein, partial [Paraglaciecola sp.]|nr:BamA/TamA family outer membrane protein [Paraglaciecola sp.]